MTRTVASLLHQRFVELPPGAGMYARPAVFAVILQTGDVGTEERGELPTTACALALVTHLVIQHIWLHFHLDPKKKDRKKGLAKLPCVSSFPEFTESLIDMSQSDATWNKASIGW